MLILGCFVLSLEGVFLVVNIYLPVDYPNS